MITVEVLASSSSGNCYRVTDGSSPLLLECGLPWREIQRRTGFQTADLAGCLISHEHGDHAKAAKDVLRAGIELHMSVGTMGALENQGFKPWKVSLLNPDPERPPARIGPWSVRPFLVQHDAAEPLGFLIAGGGEKLLYLTDSFYCRYKFTGLNIIMIECNYALDILDRNVEAGAVPPEVRRRLLRSHFSLENVKNFLRANDLRQVREIHLIHLSDGNSDAERFKREIMEVTGKPVYIAAK
jgi:phosphoribosyl 1,2-cyclic phosphodiesterase